MWREIHRTCVCARVCVCLFWHNIIHQIKKQHATYNFLLASGVYYQQISEDVSQTSRPISEVTGGMPIAWLIPPSVRAEAAGPGYLETYRREFIAVQFCHATSQNIAHEKSRIDARRSNLSSRVRCVWWISASDPLPLLNMRLRDFPVYVDPERARIYR